MQLIKKGRIPKPPVYEGECKSCRSVMRAALEELHSCGSQIDGDLGMCAKCMVCGCDVIFRKIVMRGSE